LKKVNHELDRDNNPIRLSVDEWNNRYNVFEDGKYNFTRKPPRRQFDVAIAAQMLNIFIRQSPIVGMANYIFPVNGHGLIKTIGNNDAYITPSYFVFEQYRKWMIGTKLQTEVNGSGMLSSKIKPSMSGDAKEIKLDEQTLNYIDVSAAMSSTGEINIALVNRSSSEQHSVKLELPANYTIKKKWELSYPDINAANTPDDRNKITPKITEIKGRKKDSHLILPPCGLTMIQCSKKP
jgi:alpha-L-arabinofuranosidase